MLLVVLVAVGFEAWTFLDLIRLQFEDDNSGQTSEVQSRNHAIGTGETVRLDENLSIHVLRMRVDVAADEWQYVLTVEVRNEGTERVVFRSDSLGLSSGRTLPAKETRRIPGRSSASFGLRVGIPEGTEARTWSVHWGKPELEEELMNRTIQLGKAPIRRR